MAVRKKLVLLIGPSASGKTTVTRILQEKHGFSEAISHTTREKRLGEKDQFESENPTYHFVSEKEFQQMIDNGDFIEYVEFAGNKYGISKQALLDTEGEKVILIVEPNGALQVYEWVKNNNACFKETGLYVELSAFFINVGHNEALERMCKREGYTIEDFETNMKEEIKERILARLRKDNIRENKAVLYKAAPKLIDLEFNSKKIGPEKIAAIINNYVSGEIL